MIFYGIFLLIASQLAGADENRLTCSAPIRLDINGSFRGIPVIDQGNLPICYAVSGSELFESYLKRNSASSIKEVPLSTFHVSSLDTAVISASSEAAKIGMFDQPLLGGFTCDAFNALSKIGACSRERVEYRLYSKIHGTSYSPISSKDLEQEENTLNVFYRDFVCANQGELHARIGTYTDGGCVGKIKGTDQNKSEDVSTRGFSHRLENEISCDLSSASGVKLPIDLLLLESALNSDSPFLALQNFISRDCENHRIRLKNQPTCVSDPFPISLHVSPDPEAVSKVNHKIEKQIESYLASPHPQPVGVEFCSQILKENRESSYFFGEGCQKHAAVVIGRRDCTEKTTVKPVKQFLLRNSWGRDCSPYDKIWDCDSGSIWIDEDALANNITAIVHLK